MPPSRVMPQMLERAGATVVVTSPAQLAGSAATDRLHHNHPPVHAPHCSHGPSLPVRSRAVPIISVAGPGARAAADAGPIRLQPVSVSSRRWSQLTLLATLATGAVLTVLPIYSTASCGAVAGSPETCTTGSASAFEHEGASVLIVLAVPVLVSVMPLVYPMRGVAIAAAVFLTALVVLGGFSIGLYYLPAVVLAWLAVAASGGRPDGGTDQPGVDTPERGP